MANYLLYADGGSRGNPGVAAGGAVVYSDETGELLAEIGVFVGDHASNNVAEYNGMLAGLAWVVKHDLNPVLRFRMDSKLVVEQMMGRWKIKHPAMQELALAAHRLLSGKQYSYEWVARADNSVADALANEAMDKKESFLREYL